MALERWVRPFEDGDSRLAELHLSELHPLLIQRRRDSQPKRLDRRIESLSIRQQRLETAVHGTDWRIQRTAAGVLELLARFQPRLMADVGDDPVARDQLQGLVALVEDADVIGEHPAPGGGVGLHRQVAR